MTRKQRQKSLLHFDWWLNFYALFSSDRAMRNPLILGAIKNFCRNKGHGFIAPTEGGDDIFVHISEWVRLTVSNCIIENVSSSVSASKANIFHRQATKCRIECVRFLQSMKNIKQFTFKSQISHRMSIQSGRLMETRLQRHHRRFCHLSKIN